MSRFFQGCHTAEDLKKAYRKLAKKLHPDVGGRKEDFQALQAEFSAAWDRLKNVHVNKDGKRYEKETDETAEAFMGIIEELIRLKDVDTEICGSWIWCSGNTKPYKDLFRRLGFRWSKMKQAWYYHSEPYRKYNGKEMSLDEIRGMYGSRRYQSEEEERLALQMR